MLEHKWIQRLIVKLNGGKPDNIDETFETQVKKIKHNIAFEVSKIKSRGKDNSSDYACEFLIFNY